MSDIVDIFITIVMPSLFPFMLFSNILIYSNYFNLLSDTILNKIISNFFGTTNYGSNAITFGFLFGYPNGARYVNELLNNNKIKFTEAEYLLYFINNSSPAFILSSIGIGIFNNIKIGVILLVSHIISSIIIGKILSIKNRLSINYINKEKNIDFEYNTSISFETITKSITKTLYTMCMIFGFMTIFILLHSFVFKILENLLILDKHISFFTLAILELTSGIKKISSFAFDFKLLITLISFFLGFSSLSIIFQIFSCVYKNNFKLVNIIKGKFFHGILSGIITYILLSIPNIYEHINIPESVSYNLELSNQISINNTSVIIMFLIVNIVLFYLLTKKKRLKTVSLKGG